MPETIRPPFLEPELAARKVQLAEDLWNTRDAQRVAAAYTEDCVWRNRVEFFQGREAIVAFLERKWRRELDYKLRKELWGFRNNRMAVKFQYEWHDDSGQWFRSYGNELWEFAPSGLMQRREASINDMAILPGDRTLFQAGGDRISGKVVEYLSARPPVLICRTLSSLFLSVTLLAPATAFTQSATSKASTEPEKKPAASAPAADSMSESTVTVGGKSIAYKTVAGLLTVGSTDTNDAQIALDGKWLPESGNESAKPEDGPAVARMFYTAYFAKDASPTRPIVFFYNGGPGSATMYLRMGSLGPVRLVTPDTQHQVGGPYKIIPNEFSLLDVADIVFIDAPGTGYSRVMGRDAFKSFYGVDQDAGAFDRFIRRFLTKYDKWSSPKFLFGESYGTTRDAVLGATLQQHGVDLNGIVFLSQILSFNDSADGSDGNPGTENGFFLAFPSFAATAWYHHKVAGQPAQLEPWLREVEQFSLGEYASALLQGADLGAAKKAAVAAKLESYSGIPAAVWIKANLRLTGGQFAKYLQDSTNVTTGRLDSRYAGPALDPMADSVEYDPFTDATTSAFEATMNTYAHDTLHFGENMTYKPSAREPGFNWDMKHRGPGGWPGTYTNVMHDLAYTMTVNPKMHVLLMGGYFDLGTLYFGATYEMKHLPMAEALQKNIEYQFFQTGHMVYINEPALKLLHDTTAKFIVENEK